MDEILVFGVEERQVRNVCRLTGTKRGVGANDVRVSALFVDLLLYVLDPFRPIGVVFIEPSIVFFRQLLEGP